MKIAIGGDISVTEESYELFKNGDVKTAFGSVLDVFSGCDRVMVNLECAVTEKDTPIKKIGPNLKGPLGTVRTLKAAGVTDCLLSNNHIFDYGKAGVADTFSELAECGMPYTGYGKNYEDSRKNYFVEKDGVRVGIVNVCEHEYTYATESREGARPFDPFETMEDIRQAKRECDHVIVVYHGGKEYCRYPSPRLVKACREMVRVGASAVLCQHSHIIGCYEKFEGGHILYGQGNFHFVECLEDEGWCEGLLLTLDVTKNDIKIDFIPTMAQTNGGIDLAEPERAARILSDMEKRNESLKDGTWRDGWHEYALTCTEQYKRSFCGYKESDTPAEYQKFAHYLDCEAHSDIWHELFPTYNSTNEA